MKKLAVWLVLVAAAIAARAQTTFTGVEKDAAGHPLVAGTITFQPVLFGMQKSTGMVICTIKPDGSLTGGGGACIVPNISGIQHRICIRPNAIAGPCFYYFLNPGSVDISVVTPDYIRKQLILPVK